MLVFISWSKPDARAVAEELKYCVEMCLAGLNVQAWMSEVDIEKGERWNDAVAQKLEETSVGIICMTPENLREPWLYFEAGALSKAVADARIHPLVLGGLDLGELPQPIGQFQATRFSKDEIEEMLLSIARSTQIEFKERDVRVRFARCWPTLHEVASNVTRKDAIANAFDKIAPAASTSQISEEEAAVIAFLVRCVSNGASHRPTAHEISKECNLSKIRTEVILDALMDKNFVGDAIFVNAPARYFLDRSGKEYAVANGLA